MLFKLIDTDCSPLLIDYEYEINDENLLAEYVAEMLLGHHYHILRIINSLSTTLPVQPNASIDAIINKLDSTTVEKRDGWLFQMISWIVLAERNKENGFHANYPHFAPAQHGIDGLAITLNSDNTLKKVIVTEDKCTTSPRGKITQQVFPEFALFEAGEKNNALVGIISSVIGNLNAGRILESVQNDIYKNNYRLYRIGITRESSHNTVEGRNKLFLNYNDYVKDINPDRRSGASIYIENLRDWMRNFSNKVKSCLETKKS